MALGNSCHYHLVKTVQGITSVWDLLQHDSHLNLNRQQRKRSQTKNEEETDAAGEKFTFNIKKNQPKKPPQIKAGNQNKLKYYRSSRRCSKDIFLLISVYYFISLFKVLCNKQFLFLFPEIILCRVTRLHMQAECQNKKEISTKFFFKKECS